MKNIRARRPVSVMINVTALLVALLPVVSANASPHNGYTGIATFEGIDEAVFPLYDPCTIGNHVPIPHELDAPFEGTAVYGAEGIGTEPFPVSGMLSWDVTTRCEDARGTEASGTLTLSNGFTFTGEESNASYSRSGSVITMSDSGQCNKDPSDPWTQAGCRISIRASILPLDIEGEAVQGVSVRGVMTICVATC